MPARNNDPFQEGHGQHHGERKIEQVKKVPTQTMQPDNQTLAQMQESLQAFHQGSTNISARAQFYGGKDRLALLGGHVQRVRELQEENDHLQREIEAKEGEIASAADPLAILADIEHRKVLVSRNTGEILKIHLKNEERLKRIDELKERNKKVQKEMMDVQGRFISTKDMEEKTRFASEFFILKAEIEKNMGEIDKLSQN